MISEFHLFFGRFNLFSSYENKKKEVMEKVEIIVSKTVVLFKYRKGNIGKLYLGSIH